MKVLKEILNLMKNASEPMTSACFKRIPGLEEKDSLEDIYQRRMGLGPYIKLLRMNL